MALARPTQLNHLFQDVEITAPGAGDVLTRGLTRWNNLGGPPLNVKMFGAIGDGTSHLITSQDLTDNPSGGR